MPSADHPGLPRSRYLRSRYRRCRYPAVLAVGLLAAALAGCAQNTPIDARADEPPAEVQGVAALDPVSLARDVASVTIFTGDTGSLRIERDVTPEARRWDVRRTIVGGSAAAAGGATRTQRFELQLDGSVALAEQIDRVEGVEVVFDPPMVVLPAGLAPGAQHVQELRMTVHPLGDRARVRSRGPLVNRITFVGRQPVRTPLGERQGFRLTSRFTADLAPAEVISETDQLFVPGIGLVDEIDQERTRVLGVQIRNNRERWTLDRIER